MKKMDEMDRDIKLHSEALGFRAAVLALAIWTLYELWSKLFRGDGNNFLPSTIMIVVLCVQWVSEMAMKRKMIAGDEEYKEPNRFMWITISSVAVLAVILSVGVYLASMMN